MAPMGNETSDTLRRRSRRESDRDGVFVGPATEGCIERVDVARDIARTAGDGGVLNRYEGLSVTLGFACCSDEPGRE